MTAPRSHRNFREAIVTSCVVFYYLHLVKLSVECRRHFWGAALRGSVWPRSTTGTGSGWGSPEYNTGRIIRLLYSPPCPYLKGVGPSSPTYPTPPTSSPHFLPCPYLMGSVSNPDLGGSVFKSTPGSGSVFYIQVKFSSKNSLFVQIFDDFPLF